jgi:hypothetical protein
MRPPRWSLNSEIKPTSKSGYEGWGEELLWPVGWRAADSVLISTIAAQTDFDLAV